LALLPLAVFRLSRYPAKNGQKKATLTGAEKPLVECCEHLPKAIAHSAGGCKRFGPAPQGLPGFVGLST